MKNKLRNLFQHPTVYAAAFWVGGLLFVAILADFIVMPIVAGHLAFTTQVPSVVGKSASEAEKILEENDLEFAWDTAGLFSSNVPEGGVVSQVPPAGREVKESRKVYLIRSLGLKRLIVPDLRGKSLSQAQITLKQSGFVVGTQNKQAHPTVPLGAVIVTQPAAGRQMRSGDTVSIILSSGAVGSAVLLPNLVGLKFADAVGKLDSLGFLLGRVERLPGSKGQTSDMVLSMEPLPLVEFPMGTAIHLVIVD